jgi:hypothetical protein
MGQPLLVLEESCALLEHEGMLPSHIVLDEPAPDVVPEVVPPPVVV